MPLAATASRRVLPSSTTAGTTAASSLPGRNWCTKLRKSPGRSSRLLREVLEAGRIKAVDSSAGTQLMRHVPNWAQLLDAKRHALGLQSASR